MSIIGTQIIIEETNGRRKRDERKKKRKEKGKEKREEGRRGKGIPLLDNKFYLDYCDRLVCLLPLLPFNSLVFLRVDTVIFSKE